MTGIKPGDEVRATGHQRESATPMDDGALLADCSCGATYSVPQGVDEYDALEAAHARHIADEALCAAVMAIHDADMRCEVTPDRPRAAVARQIRERYPTNAAAKPFVTHLVRCHLLGDEA